jgi:hypothetical protein
MKFFFSFITFELNGRPTVKAPIAAMVTQKISPPLNRARLVKTSFTDCTESLGFSKNFQKGFFIKAKNSVSLWTHDYIQKT